MFTGLVEAVGRVSAMQGRAPLRLSIDSGLPTDAIAIGDSIAIDGCCLTVVERAGQVLSFEAATETLERTTLGQLHVGERVNLERALKVGDHLGGHWVAGHVDGVGRVVSREQRGSAVYYTVEAPQEVAPFVAPRGSVCLAGISLTVTSVEGDCFDVAVIPHTLGVTTLGDMSVGAKVNVEADLIARYVGRLLSHGGAGAGPEASRLSIETLRQHGFA